MPFYKEPFENLLRFGDIICGFVSSIPIIDTPSVDNKHIDYKIKLSMPEFCAVLSPCCSIGNATITLAPLDIITRNFFSNPYFAVDLTNINRKVTPEQSVSPGEWNGFSEEVRQRRQEEKTTYAFVELFLYAENPRLPRYQVKLRGDNVVDTGYYIIDFRKSFRIESHRIQNPENSPVEGKILQLSVNTRQELREKISYYFSRLPPEDKIQLQII